MVIFGDFPLVLMVEKHRKTRKLVDTGWWFFADFGTKFLMTFQKQLGMSIFHNVP
jgi:hypothetical protein